MTQFPARIHVLLARDSPTGVVIRRGPSKVVATVHWHREIGGSWTAISRAPYLKAITIYEDDCWFGGGLWMSNEKYWLNLSNKEYWLNGRGTLRQAIEVHSDDQVRPIREFGHGCEGVYYPRLLRDGWQLKERTRTMMGNCIDLFQKQVAGSWNLHKFCQSGSEEHELYNVETGVSIYKHDWEWAEVDRHRLIWASGGKLFSAILDGTGLTCETELHNFNSMQFRTIEAPY